MKRGPFAVLGACVFVPILTSRGFGATEPGPHPDNHMYATRPLPEGLANVPPSEWYEAIGARPVRELLKEEGCYAVLRVERGFYESIVMGHYLCVTVSFRNPELLVETRSLLLPDYRDHRAKAAYSLWSGYVKRPEFKEITRQLTKTRTDTFMPDEGTPRDVLARELNRLSIGSLPSVWAQDTWRPFPPGRFTKQVRADGKAGWALTFHSGGGSGDSPTWRVTAAASWEYGSRRREMFHEFAVQDPFLISDARYEQILMAVAEFSEMLKAEIAQKHRQLAEWRQRRAAETEAADK